MQSRGKRLVSAALQNLKRKSDIDEQIPSTSGLQNWSPQFLASESDFDSDDSVVDKDYEPPKNQKTYNIAAQCSKQSVIKNLNIRIHNENYEPREANILLDDSGSESYFIPCSQPCLEKTIPESSDESTKEDVVLTKKGTVRKRKKYDVSLKERKQIKREEKICTKYFVKPGCQENICKKKCSTKFSEDYRKTINSNFWKMSWSEQKHFYLANTMQQKPVRPKKKSHDDEHGKHYDRTKSVSYFFCDKNGEKVAVCKTFFITTLGYKKNNCKAVRNIIDTYYKTQYAEPIIDGRGHNPNPSQIDRTKIKEHIMSFRPVVSHYRRVHAPNRKYLPSDINIRMMYDNYCEKEPEINVSYGFYRNVVNELKISFTKLGHEECELCEEFSIHNPNAEIRHRNCKECKEYEDHHTRYISARKKYEEDVQSQTKQKSTDTTIFAVDLEKVIMLPRMDEFKTVMFCPRLIVFNQSFVPVGDKRLHGVGKTLGVLWHEAIAGRKKEDIISCFQAFFLENRDYKHVILWLDNCAAQNKNWCLFSYLVYLVNSKDVTIETVVLRYLEVGHTFMAADEFHHRVEQSLKKNKRVYDFEDFCKAVSDTGPNTVVKKMTVQDFHDFEDCSSSYKLQNSVPRAYLRNKSEITFRRGSKSMFYKNSHDTEEQIELDFLRVKNLKIGISSPKQKLSPRGITSERKSAILSKLGPLMPDNRRGFWKNLPVSDSSADLTEIYED
nr:uncharacterized protein LOC128681791 [Plodia interpunctella]